jgi:PAS domain S-box-containing protein
MHSLLAWLTARQRALRRPLASFCFLLLLALLVVGCALRPAPEPSLRVAVYQNRPKVFIDLKGVPQGIFVDVLNEIAQAENWAVEYVPGTWAEGLARLESGEIDVVMDMSFTPQRSEQYDLNVTPVLESWLDVYTRNDQRIGSVRELDGKRIAVLAGSVQEDYLREVLAPALASSITVLPFDDYPASVEAVRSGQADALVATRFFGFSPEGDDALVSSHVVLRPESLYFAFAQGTDPALIAALDRHLAAMKNDPESVYYRSLKRWLGEQPRTLLPGYVKAILAILSGLAAAAGLFVVLLRGQVAARTHELAAATRLLADTQAIAHLGGWEYDVATCRSTWTDEVYRIYGVGHELDLNDTPRAISLYAPQHRPVIEAAFRRAVEAGEPYDLELEFIRPDGAAIWVCTIGRPVVEEGLVTRVTGYTMDITARKRMEQELRESRETYGMLFNSSNDAVFVHSLNGAAAQGAAALGTFVEVNDVACAMLGYTRGELLALSPNDITLSGDSASGAEAMLSAGRAVFEVTHVTKTGEEIPVEISSRVFERDGHRHVLSIARDITARKRAADALQESVALLNAVVENIPLMLFLKEATDLSFVLFNRAGEELLGYDRKALLGRNNLDLFPPEQAAHFMAKDREVLDGEAGYLDIPEEPILTANQDQRLLHTRKVRILGADGTTRYLLGISEDITERKQLEVERERLMGQLIQSQKMEAVGRLAGGVAHDFNNMLAVILGNTDLVMGEVDHFAPMYADLTEIRKAAQRSADLTRQLLAFSRQQTIAPRVLDLNDTVEGMLKMLRRLIGEDIDLAWLPNKGLWPVKMDPSQVDQILANLCVNARDAIAGVGKVTIETGRAVLDAAYCADHLGAAPGDYVMLVVRDDGCGMDKAVLERLFEPFFTTKAVGEGTGLGLATVYGIVKQNEGHITVYSEPGVGTTFHIYLPRHVGEGAETESAPQGALPRGTETVLLVEDEPSILHLGERMLAGLGYTVLAAATADEALRLSAAYDGPIPLLLTDVVMPEMSGKDLAERLRAIRPALRCLYMSGYTASVIAHRGVLEEGVRFIQKPFMLQALAAKVRAVLDEG